MLWTSALSDEVTLEKAAQAVAERLRIALDGKAPDLVLAFVSGYPLMETERLPQLLQEFLPGRHLLGCTAGGVIGGGQEVEKHPALSLTAALLPGVQLNPFHLENDDLAADAKPGHWQNRLGLAPTVSPHFILLPDPFTFETDAFIWDLDQALPASQKIGGMASGGRGPGSNQLFLDGKTFHSGAVGIALSGDVELETLVAQGCRPVGNPMFITRCQEHLLQSIDGKPVSEVLQGLFTGLNARDQELFQNSLFLGIVMKDTQREYHQGDFLIRNILGFDKVSESLAIGATLIMGQVVQFHLRDAHTSAEDLQALLMRYKTAHLTQSSPEGALLFSCLGRGVQLYQQSNHDSNLFRRFLGEVPLGGFFCNGEIGPVHGQTFLHGYTSSFGIFRRKS